MTHLSTVITTRNEQRDTTGHSGTVPLSRCDCTERVSGLLKRVPFPCAVPLRLRGCGKLSFVPLQNRMEQQGASDTRKAKKVTVPNLAQSNQGD